MKKTQPLVTSLPNPAIAPAAISVAIDEPEEEEMIADEIPMWLCWALLGGSAIILLIQIWNYFA